MDSIIKDLEQTKIENDQIEFKLRLEPDEDKIEKWAKTLVGFANMAGGTIAVGFDNVGNMVGLEPDVVDQTKNLVLRVNDRHIFPHLTIEFETKAIGNGRFILLLKVEPADQIIIYRRGDFNEVVYLRKNGATLPATVAEILNLGKRKFGTDAQILDRTFAKKDFSQYIQLGKLYRDDNKEIGLKELIDQEVVAPDGRISEGLSMFADDYDSEETLIACRLWDGYDKGVDEVIDKKEFHGPLGVIFVEAMNFVKRNTRTGLIKQKDGSRRDIASYPEVALREALINAIAHRDYSIEGTQIDVDIFKDRLIIASPGGCLLPQDPESYPLNNVPSIRRNRKICGCFTAIGLMEKNGSGFAKIYDAYKDEKAPEPVLEATSGSFMIVLFDLLDDGTGIQMNDLCPKAQEILAYCENEAHTRKEIQDHLGIASRSYMTAKCLAPLVKKGYLKTTARANSPIVKYLTVKRK